MKKCPFCGMELPEEAVYCLNCASVLNERHTVSHIEKKTKSKKSITIISNKKITGIVAIVCAVIIVLFSCFLVIKSVKTEKPDVKKPPQTSIIPVTEENGEIATNDEGAQIFEVTEITETTTKKGLLEILFDKDEPEETEKDDSTDNSSNAETEGTTSADETESNSNQEPITEVRTTIITMPVETTTKKSFWDTLMGIDTPTVPDNETTTKKTETTTKKAETTTKPASTTTTTNPATTTTKPETTIPVQPSAADFEYTEINGKIKITKYTGNSSTVTVPAYINGKHVALLGENAFANNSNINKIVFTGTTSGKELFYLPTKRVVFNNLPNLTSITFPYETHFRMTDDSLSPSNFTFYDLIVNCPKINGIYFTEKVNSDYSSSTKLMYSVDGVVFAQMNTDKKNGQPYDSYLLYYPLEKTDSSYTIPSRVIQVEKFAFRNNTHIKSVNFTATTRYIAANFIGCKNLSQFTVDADNQYLFAENGVIYTGSATVNGISYKSFFYPPGKTDTSYTFTDKYNLSMDEYSFCGNPYIKTAKFCCGALIYRNLQDGVGRPTALTSIMLNDAYANKVDTSSSAPFTITYY